MEHLLGFWEEDNWNDTAWAEYQRRRREHPTRNRIEQALHRLMGMLTTEKSWRRRERKQWPSTSGSYDACEDHYNYLLGAGRQHEALMLKRRAQEYRPEFLT